MVAPPRSTVTTRPVIQARTVRRLMVVSRTIPSPLKTE
jgi:hypothetical protein